MKQSLNPAALVLNTQARKIMLHNVGHFFSDGMKYLDRSLLSSSVCAASTYFVKPDTSANSDVRNTLVVSDTQTVEIDSRIGFAILNAAQISFADREEESARRENCIRKSRNFPCARHSARVHSQLPVRYSDATGYFRRRSNHKRWPQTDTVIRRRPSC